ncbi:hypothetical protein [Phenylobacterium sp.]|uniref:hypothetical protein n=1 Tax=Phenylobacterium sp. TaxID=1871053 RepID=UPI0025E3EAD4|nr:hypothetical protein [Phenylobacterium sp.]MBX3483971.1 hypothetical protein [Phenylobacterium sp.]MCW5758305.1 hypothetical protein [Phenylobacterium sp.]
MSGRTSRVVALVLAGAMLSGCASTLRWMGHRQQVGPYSIFEAQTRGSLVDRCKAAESNETNPAWNDAREKPYRRLSDDPFTGGRGRYQHSVLITHCDHVRKFYAAPMDLQPDAAVDHYREGVVLADAQCINWFAMLDGTRRASATARGFTSGVFTLATVVQGFTGVEPNAIGIVAATGRSVSEGFGNVEANYLLSQELPSAYEAFQAYRSRLAQAYLEGGVIVDRVSADQYLQDYEATCSSSGLQTFLNKAVQAAGRGQAIQEALPPILRADLDVAAAVAGVDLGSIRPLNDNDLTYLALLWFVEPQKAEGAKGDADKQKIYDKAVAALDKKLDRNVPTENGDRSLKALATADTEGVKRAKAQLKKSNGLAHLTKAAAVLYEAEATAKPPAATVAAGG